MKILIDLFSTDYGLMSLIVLALIMGAMTWATVFVVLAARKK